MTQPPYGQGQYGQNEPYGQNQGQYGQNPPQYGQQPQYGQPQQPQQQYGQYGQPYSAAAAAYGDPVGSGAKFGVVGATLAGVGAVLLIISFTALDWLSEGSNSANFSDLKDFSDTSSAPGVTKTYFGWLAWTLLVVTLLVAIIANLPSPASGPLRAFGAILAVAAIALTLFALKGDGSFGDIFKDASAGFYLALAGFLIMGIGALVGPTRTRTTVVRTY